MPDLSKGPAVSFPPPVLFAGGFLAAWGLDHLLPFALAGSGAPLTQEILGVCLLAAGLAFMAGGVWTFTRHRTAIIPHRPARELVRSGPYRFTRNPMYVGLTSAYVGLAVALNLAWPLLLLPAVLTLLTTLVIRREERYLCLAFGDEYEIYCRQVRRWL
jgi:protein-S-isoprenylcysteine O-methyltransferase Ste14